MIVILCVIAFIAFCFMFGPIIGFFAIFIAVDFVLYLFACLIWWMGHAGGNMTGFWILMAFYSPIAYAQIRAVVAVVTMPKAPTAEESLKAFEDSYQRNRRLYPEETRSGMSLESASVPHPLITEEPPIYMPALAIEDLADKSDDQLVFLRASYYARHGYAFPGSGVLVDRLRHYFAAQPWFDPNTATMSVAWSRMTGVEQSNVDLITAVEAARRNRDSS